MSTVTLLIGHRGSGKSGLLERLRRYHAEAGTQVEAVDLDRKIDERQGVSIAEIFASHGEAHFRDLERSTLRELLSTPRQAPLVVALGAGFEGPIPEVARCIWIRRPTDSQGRIFLDPERRPRLEPGRAPLEEFELRARARNPRYAAWADEHWCIPEGADEPNEGERFFFDLGPNPMPDAQIGGAVTLLPELFAARGRLESYLARRVEWGTRFELRDDLLSEAEIHRALALLPPDQVIYSVRRPSVGAPKIPAGVLWDWPLELGRVPEECLAEGRAPRIVSLHEREPGPLSASLHKLEKSALSETTWLKLAVEIHGFSELEEAHAWAMQDPAHRAFLPRSPDGRWKWYRLLTGRAYPLSFIRDSGEGSATDQPWLSEWLAMCRFGSPRAFSAVLGDPVSHSRTPFEQKRFFETFGWPVLAVRISEDEWDQGALAKLERLGLRAAAVTSPLKRKAYDSCTRRTDLAEALGSVNSLSRTNSGWSGHNTDLEGLRALLRKAGVEQSSASRNEIAVWGGGGTLPLLRELLPRAQFFSARTGTLRSGLAPRDEFSPWFVIWGVGRTRSRPEAWPPGSWKIGCVVDLNYSEDSPGRELALERGALYVSGLEMFRIQAEGQRRFWSGEN